MNYEIDYIETVRNSYKVTLNEEDFKKKYGNRSFEEVLKQDFDNNIWAMQDDVKMDIKFLEAIDILDTDLEPVDIIET